MSDPKSWRKVFRDKCEVYVLDAMSGATSKNSDQVETFGKLLWFLLFEGRVDMSLEDFVHRASIGQMGDHEPVWLMSAAELLGQCLRGDEQMSFNQIYENAVFKRHKETDFDDVQVQMFRR